MRLSEAICRIGFEELGARAVRLVRATWLRVAPD